MTASALKPVQASERSAILDLLRGFALFGILLDNIFGFTGYSFFTDDMKKALPTYQADNILAFAEIAFVHGKFYSIFSLLFGIGFSVILLRTTEKGINPLYVFYRRMLVLLAIGIVHVCMIWEGDILFLYALIGFLLPLFRKCTNRQLLILSAFFILSPILIDIIKILFHFHWGAWFQEKAQAADVRNGIPLDKSYATWLYEPGNSWERWRKWTDSGYLYRFAYILATNRIPKVLGLFLLGFYIGRNLMYRQLDHHQSLLRFITKWGFIIGIPLNIALAHFDRDGKEIPDPAGMIDTVLNAFGVVPLSLAYIGSICLLWMKSRPAGFLKLLTAPGRMALTNYLSQSIIGILLFYSLGLGLGGDIGPSIFFPAAAGIFLFQVLFSNWWLQYFQFGPLEWLWRQLTYGKRLSIRKPRQPQ